jgi:hypothetical protein
MTQEQLIDFIRLHITENGTNDITGLIAREVFETIVNEIYDTFGVSVPGLTLTNLIGYASFVDGSARVINIGDLFINSDPDGNGMYNGDWIISLDSGEEDFSGVTPLTTNSLWFYIPFGQLKDPATVQAFLEAFNPFTEVSFTSLSYLIELNAVTSKNVTLKHKTTPATYAVSNFGKGTAGDTKKLWIELGAATTYIVRIYTNGLGSVGIHIPGVSGGGYVEFKGNGLSQVHGFVDAVCLANNQWIVTNISNSTVTGPKSSSGTLHLDGTEPFDFVEPTIYIPVICDAAVTITLGTADHLNGVTHTVLVDCDGYALTFSSDYDIISGTIDATAGNINHITMIYDIVNSKVRVIISNNL